MATALDKKVLARRLAAQRAEKAKIGTSQAEKAFGEAASRALVSNPQGTSSDKSPSKETSRKRPRNFSLRLDVVKDAGPELPTEGTGVQVFQDFTGSGPNIYSLWDNRFDVHQVIDNNLLLKSDVKYLDKWGPRSAQLMLQHIGVRAAALSRYLEWHDAFSSSREFELTKSVDDLQKQLVGYEEMKSKVAGLEGRVVLLTKENEDLRKDKDSLTGQIATEKTARIKAEESLAGVLEEKKKVEEAKDEIEASAAQTYDQGFSQALEQVRTLYPSLDVSSCDVLKKVVDGVLMEMVLEDGGSGPKGNDEGKADGDGEVHGSDPSSVRPVEETEKTPVDQL